MASSQICRLCLRQGPVYLSLLEGDAPEMVEALTSIKVSAADDTSTSICPKCLLNLRLAFKIQQNMLKADEKLKKSMCGSGVRIKQENSDGIEMEELIIDDSTDFKVPQRPRVEDLVSLCKSRCLVCGENLKSKQLNEHVKQHFEARQKCEPCNKMFRNVERYRKHIVSEHGTDLVHKCDTCEAKFLYRSFYDVHLEKAHPTPPSTLEEPVNDPLAVAPKNGIAKLVKLSRPALKLLLRVKTDPRSLIETYVCQECNKKFSSKKQMSAHSHKKQTCPVCKHDISIHNIKRHIEKHSCEAQICELCGASFKNHDSLRQHRFYTHNEMRYKCKDCGKAFRKKNKRDTHQRREHGGEPTHICDTCGKKFYTFQYLDKHIKMTHLKLRPFICEFCKRGFSSYFAMKTHRRQHTNETPYRCEVCGEGFRQNVSLRAHRKSKHNIVEPTICKCKVCEKGFASEAALKAHSRLH